MKSQLKAASSQLERVFREHIAKYYPQYQKVQAANGAKEVEEPEKDEKLPKPEVKDGSV